jgi:hypothetical protein
MNSKIAFELLDIDSNTAYNKINLKYLTNKYKKQALRHHPDKNGNTPESTEKFKQIYNAYDYLKRELPEFSDCEEEPDDINISSPIYEDLLKLFMKGFMDGKYNEFITKIIQDIITGCKQISIKLFENLDKESSLNIYTFLSKHKYIFHLSDELLEKVQQIVMEKCKEDIIYKLNPSIDDLFDNNVYKLYIEDVLYLVPLWHNELYFDGSGCEIIVLCHPELPEDIQIDEDGNIYCEIHISIDAMRELIFEEEDIDFYIGKKQFFIPLKELYIQKKQYYRIKKMGLSKINEKDIYDVSERSDIIVQINVERLLF